MGIEKVLKVRVVEGKLFVDTKDIDYAMNLRGYHYLISEEGLCKLLDKTRESDSEDEWEDKEVYIPIEDEMISGEPPYNIPREIKDGDITYYIDRQMLVVPGQIMLVKYRTPDNELEDIVDEGRNIPIGEG